MIDNLTEKYKRGLWDFFGTVNPLFEGVPDNFVHPPQKSILILLKMNSQSHERAYGAEFLFISI